MKEGPSDHAEISIGDGYVALVDADDWLWLSQWEWQPLVNIKKTGEYIYAIRSNTRDGKRKRVLMHREILRCPQGMVVDHANHNTLDNRRSNIRIATHSQNMANRRVSWNQFGLKGVTYVGGERPWSGAVVKGGVRQSIGFHATAELAAAAYDALAVQIYGKFAKTNASIAAENFLLKGGL